MNKPDSPNYLAALAFSIAFGLLILFLGWLGGKKSWNGAGKKYTPTIPSKRRA